MILRIYDVSGISLIFMRPIVGTDEWFGHVHATGVANTFRIYDIAGVFCYTGDASQLLDKAAWGLTNSSPLTVTLDSVIVAQLPVPLVKGPPKRGGFATGGIVPKTAEMPTFLPTDKFTPEWMFPKHEEPKPDNGCPECFGTGLKGGFMHPCSKGCSQ